MALSLEVYCAFKTYVYGRSGDISEIPEYRVNLTDDPRRGLGNARECGWAWMCVAPEKTQSIKILATVAKLF